MNSLVLSDVMISDDLFPFSLTSSAVDIRLGILTLREKWEKLFSFKVQVNSIGSSAASTLPANLNHSKALREFIRRGIQDDASSSKWKQFRQIQYPWHIFQYNAEEIIKDFELITTGRVSQ